MFIKKSKCVAFLIGILVLAWYLLDAGISRMQCKKSRRENFTLKLSHPANTNHPIQYGAEEFKKLVEAGTGGKSYNSDISKHQLGSPKDVAQALRLHMRYGYIRHGIFNIICRKIWCAGSAICISQL